LPELRCGADVARRWDSDSLAAPEPGGGGPVGGQGPLPGTSGRGSQPSRRRVVGATEAAAARFAAREM